jgi:hypothetical protein
VSGGIHNVITKVMKLTRGKLLKGPDWEEWQSSEYLQLNQYHTQGMFGTPLLVDDDAAVFHTVWTYDIKALDECKKACMVCDGSLRVGQAHVLDETYANCVDQTSSRMFYAIAAAENLLIYGADVPTPSPKHRPPNKVFISTQTVLLTNGGYVICSALRWNQAKSSLFSPQCKVTLNHHASGKSTPTLFSRILV